MQKKSKKITLASLAATVDAGFKRMDKGFKATKKGFKDAKEDNESLARMVANGFEHVGKDISDVKDSMAKLEQGQENIILRLDGKAPKFEVKQLERRVKRLEDKAGIRHSIQH